MNKIKQIYGNGCSFIRDKLPLDPDYRPGYLEMIADELGVPSENAGLPGSCNRRIIRSTLRDSLNHDGSTLFIIQLTHLHRTERASERNGINDWKFDREDYFESVKPHNESVEPHNSAYVKHHLRYFDERAAMTDLTADVLMLAAWLRDREIPYYIFSYLPLISEKTAQELQDHYLDIQARHDPCVMPLLDQSLAYKLGPGDWYYDANGNNFDIGHFNAVGHIRAKELLLSELNRHVLPKL
jgi:hypothetical protein